MASPYFLDAFFCRQWFKKEDSACPAVMYFFDVEGKVCELGFPIITGSGTLVPFDYIPDIFRGTKGAMLDMIRVPDKFLA